MQIGNNHFVYGTSRLVRACLFYVIVMKNFSLLLFTIVALALTSCENNHVDPDWTATIDSADYVIPQPVSRELSVSVTVDLDAVIQYSGDADNREPIRPVMHPDDRIYIFAIPISEPIYRMTGYLTMDAGSLSSDMRSARFSGTLYIYKGGQPSPDMPFRSDNYLAECRAEAHLVPAGMNADFFMTNYSNIYSYNSGLSLVQGSGCVERLVEQVLPIRSETYDATNRRFSAFYASPMFRFEVKGLSNGEYSVTLGTTKDDIQTATISYAQVCNLRNSCTFHTKLNVAKSGDAVFAVAFPAIQNIEHILLGIQGLQPNPEYGFYVGRTQLKNNMCYIVSTDARIDH